MTDRSSNEGYSWLAAVTYGLGLLVGAFVFAVGSVGFQGGRKPPLSWGNVLGVAISFGVAGFIGGLGLRHFVLWLASTVAFALGGVVAGALIFVDFENDLLTLLGLLCGLATAGILLAVATGFVRDYEGGEG